MCPVDPTIWLYYSMNIKRKAEANFDFNFYTSCNAAITARYGADLHGGVTHENWIDLYKYLINNVSL